MYMLVQMAEEDATAAVAAVSRFAIGEPLLLAQRSADDAKLRASSANTIEHIGVDEDLAVGIADAVRPTSRRPLRRDTLRVFFGMEDIQGGVLLRHPGGNEALRNGVVAIAKAPLPQ